MLAIKTPYNNTSYCVISLLDVVSGHGINIPRSLVLKIILMTWLYCSMLVTTSYSTGYSSYLTEKKYHPRINTLEQLSKMDDMKICEIEHAEANALIKYEVLSSQYSMVAKFSSHWDPFPEGGWDEVVKRLKSGKRVLYSRFMAFKYFIDLGIFDNRDYREIIEPMEEAVDHCPLTIAISPRSPYVHLLRRRFFYALEHGLMKHWIEQYMQKHKEMEFDKNIIKQPPKVLSVTDIRGAFLFLVMGYLFAFISFIMEHIHKRGKTSTKNNFRTIVYYN